MGKKETIPTFKEFSSDRKWNYLWHLLSFDNPKGLSKQNLLEAVQFLYKELESRCDINSL